MGTAGEQPAAPAEPPPPAALPPPPLAAPAEPPRPPAPPPALVVVVPVAVASVSSPGQAPRRGSAPSGARARTSRRVFMRRSEAARRDGHGGADGARRLPLPVALV